MEVNGIHLDLAEQLLLSIKQGGKKALITYGDLCKRAGNIVSPRNSANYIGDLSVICYENNMPLTVYWMPPELTFGSAGICTY